MPQEATITAIDLGTDKCVTLIAKVNTETKNLKVVGVSAVAARGMKRSQIIDLEQVLATITESLDGAERMAGFEVQSAYVSISGGHIQSQNSKGVVAVASPEQEITPFDVSRVIEAARAISLPSDREIIHVIPNSFKLDSQEGIKDPVGMTGVRLEAEAHIITAMSVALKNLQRCLENLGLTVNAFVFDGLAAADVVLSDTEKELGVAVVDIGAGTTSVCAFVDGSLIFSGSIPVGARHVTQDIALGCKVSLDTAEQIKLKLSNEDLRPLKPLSGESKQDFNTRRKKLDELQLADFTNGESTESISKKVVIEGIVVPRLEEIFHLISDQLDSHRLNTSIPAGIVITGGGAETVAVTQVAKQQLKVPARVGLPTQLDGLTLDIHKPAFATSIGLLMYGKQHGEPDQGSSFSLSGILGSGGLGKTATRILDMIKSLLP